MVLPLPGSSMRYPRGLRGIYDAAARRLLGVPLDTFHRRPW